VAAIIALTGEDASRYMDGYGLQPVPHLIIARKRAIGNAIGCTVAIEEVA
jgi:hypothetical protein